MCADKEDYIIRCWQALREKLDDLKTSCEYLSDCLQKNNEELNHIKEYLRRAEGRHLENEHRIIDIDNKLKGIICTQSSKN